MYNGCDGKLTPSYETHCPKCERAALGLGKTVKEATAQLYKDGWKMIKGLWHCEDCAK